MSPIRFSRRGRTGGAIAPSLTTGTSCFAPSVQLFLKPDGEVLPCCTHLSGFGNIRDEPLSQIWAGVRRRQLVDLLAQNDFSGGCENCGVEIEVEGREHSYASFFEVRATHVTPDPASVAWPRWIDFNLSTSCNLQCIQCSGELSSAIRIHREKRAPLESPYDDRFFEDLRAFIPHLDGALFAGGEPFMGAENFRVWDLIEELRPGLPCTVTTNATQWTPRIERLLERLPFSFVFSLDAMTARTFESIRVGADHAAVLANVDRFTEYARRRGTSATINHCLMVQNHHEFADLLLWAEGLGLPVVVSVVRTPPDCSIASLPPDRLREVQLELQRRDAEMRDRLGLNLRTWVAEFERIGSWVAAASPVESAVTLPQSPTVLMFRCDGNGYHDDAAARAELATHSLDGVVHSLEVGRDDLIGGLSDSLQPLMAEHGIEPDEIVGRHFALVEDISVRMFGPRTRYEQVRKTADRMDAIAVYGDTELRICMIALRDEAGIATAGRILMAISSDGTMLNGMR